MTILRAGVDQGLGVRNMRRTPASDQAAHAFACELLLPAIEAALCNRFIKPSARAARAHFGPGPAKAAPALCAYAVRALARPDLAALALRTERGRELIGAVIESLAGEGGWRG